MVKTEFMFAIKDSEIGKSRKCDQCGKEYKPADQLKNCCSESCAKAFLDKCVAELLGKVK